MKKKYYILIGLIVVAIALVIGTSYAYFMVNVTGGNDGNETVIKSGNLSLILTDNEILSLNGIPGDSATKQFTVENNGTTTVTYNIKMVDVINTFVDKNDLVYSLKGDNGVDITEAVMPSTSDEYLATDISIGSGIIHTYTLTITFKETNDNQDDNKNATFTGRINIDNGHSLYQDESGANAPELLDNMIPVLYNGTDWEYADVYDKWYDYDNKEWANAVVLNEGISKNVGDTISEDDIALWYVWIPRYTYTIFNGNNEVVPEQEIQIKFEGGIESTGTVDCVDAISSSGTSSEVCTDITNGSVTNNVSTYTHPAFTFGDEELTGFWAGKFEVSGTVDKIEIKPNVSSLRNETVSSFFYAIQNMSTQYNLNGDSHMMKNMEWGAVAYLSHSKYGTCRNGACEEISRNNNSSFITGYAAVNAATIGWSETSVATNEFGTNPSITQPYNTEVGVKASTTGNIYGIYDMSGGSWEYVMGSIVNNDGTFYANTSGFTEAPYSKFFDSYTYSDFNNTYFRGKLGDATKEILKIIDSTVDGWYKDYADFPNMGFPWFGRGGRYMEGNSAGVFLFGRSLGGTFDHSSARAVLTNL